MGTAPNQKEIAMEPITLRARDLGVVVAVTERAAKIAKRLGLPAPTFREVDRFVQTDDDGLPCEMVQIEFDDVDLRVGDFHLVAVIDHKAGVVTSVPGSPEGTVQRMTGHDNTCDHCGTRRERTMTFLVVDADGNEKHVGRNCLKDFLGHANLSTTSMFALMALYADLPGAIEEGVGLGLGGHGRSTLEWVVAAAAAIREFGYVPASSEYKRPTRIEASAILYSQDPIERKHLPKVSPEDWEFARLALEFVVASTESGDFALRMRQVAAIPGVADRYAGVAVFIPEAYRRHLDKEAEKTARAKTEIPSSPCPLGKIDLVGEVISISFQENHFSYYGGSIKKLVVLDDRGFKVYVTEPAKIVTEIGDRVSMSVTVEGVSDRDPSFGFGKRPSKATVLADARASA